MFRPTCPYFRPAGTVVVDRRNLPAPSEPDLERYSDPCFSAEDELSMFHSHLLAHVQESPKEKKRSRDESKQEDQGSSEYAYKNLPEPMVPPSSTSTCTLRAPPPGIGPFTSRTSGGRPSRLPRRKRAGGSLPPSHLPTHPERKHQRFTLRAPGEPCTYRDTSLITCGDSDNACFFLFKKTLSHKRLLVS